jgi:hypothetical protein
MSTVNINTNAPQMQNTGAKMFGQDASGNVGYLLWAATNGYTGSQGTTGGLGYTGSASTVVGYTGSASTVAGYTGSIGYTGSGGVGYTGSAGSGSTGGSGVANVQVVAANTNAFPGNLYVITANSTIFLPSNPSVANTIYISNDTGYANSIINRSSQNIMGVSQDMNIDVVGAGFTLIFSGNTNGWVII